MLNGETITVRPVTEADLTRLYERNIDLENRGEFFGLNFRTMSELKRDYAKHGFWSDEFGMLLICPRGTDEFIGQVVWFPTVRYMDEIEVGYIMWDQSARRRGAMTEAVKLFTRYLFDTRILNRIRLCIASGNIASRRVAEKAGYTHELTQRGSDFHRNKRFDMELYAFLRSDLAKAQ
ncbi:MAG: GNAT family protein [Chloroflexota bacterium]